MVNVTKGILVECDPAMKQFLLHLDEKFLLGSKFIIQGRFQVVLCKKNIFLYFKGNCTNFLNFRSGWDSSVHFSRCVGHAQVSDWWSDGQDFSSNCRRKRSSQKLKKIIQWQWIEQNSKVYETKTLCSLKTEITHFCDLQFWLATAWVMSQSIRTEHSQYEW